MGQCITVNGTRLTPCELKQLERRNLIVALTRDIEACEGSIKTLREAEQIFKELIKDQIVLQTRLLKRRDELPLPSFSM